MEFNSVREKLVHIQKNEKEQFLFPVLKQLFLKKKFKNIEITHGANEYGKDLVFKDYDEKLSIEKWISVVVKNRNATNVDFELGGELIRQVDTSFKTPYLDSTGKENHISFVIIIVNGSVTSNARKIINEHLPSHMCTNVEIWNYQKLENEIENFLKEEFLYSNTSKLDKESITANIYRANQIKKLSSISNSKEIFQGLDINDIKDIFVNVRTSYKRFQEEKKKYQDGDKKKIKIEEIDDSISILNSNKHCIIHGIAASGKSLLLKRIGINALENPKTTRNAVFYFELRKFQDSTKFLIDNLILEQYKQLTSEESFNKELYSKIVILLDGLDEIKSDDSKLKVISIITTFISEHEKKNIQVLLTSRNIEFIEESDLLKTFERIELLPFDIGQALSLVRKIIPNNKEKATNFVKAIKNNQLSNSLTRTPMALTLTAILYRDGEVDLTELPANITELYNKFTDYYLNRWDTSKGISLQYKYEEVRQIIGFIASDIHLKGIQEISEKDLVSFLNRLAENYPYEDLTDIESFVEKLKNRIGIIHYFSDEKVFKFYHLSFQEYFASLFFDDSNENKLFENFYSEWWENPIIFYCGKQPKRDVFLLKALKTLTPIDAQQNFQYLSLLSKSLQAAHLISKKSQKTLIENLIFRYDQFYKEIVKADISNEYGFTYSVSTLDLIIQLRDFFNKLFSTKHIYFTSFSEIALKILVEESNNYSDITLYSLSYFLSFKLKDGLYLEEFIKNSNLNVRWTRIVYRDLQYLRLNKQVDSKLYQRIIRKQRKNQEYIKEQFSQPAIVHILDNLSRFNGNE